MWERRGIVLSIGEGEPLGKLPWSQESESEVAQSCPPLCDPMDCSLPGSSLHGILQARVLEWVAIFLLQGIFLNQGLNPGLPHCRQTDALPSEPPGKLMQVKKQQLKQDMEQWTGSKLGKEYVKAVYCHLAYFTSMQNTSCEMPD